MVKSSNQTEKASIEKLWFRWGSNPGPLACEASVITTTLRNPTYEKPTGYKIPLKCLIKMSCNNKAKAQ